MAGNGPYLIAVLPNIPEGRYSYGPYQVGGALYVVIEEIEASIDVFKSTNNGQTWNQVGDYTLEYRYFDSDTLLNNCLDSVNGKIYMLAALSHKLSVLEFDPAGGGISLVDGDGPTINGMTDVGSPPGGTSAMMSTDGEILFAYDVGNGLYLRTYSGGWISTTQIESASALYANYICALTKVSGTAYVFWEAFYNDLSGVELRGSAETGSTFIVDSGSGFRYSGFGQNRMLNGFPYFVESGSFYLGGSDTSNVYLYSGPPDDLVKTTVSSVSDIAYTPGFLKVGQSVVATWFVTTDESNRIVASVLDGETWGAPFTILELMGSVPDYILSRNFSILPQSDGFIGMVFDIATLDACDFYYANYQIVEGSAGSAMVIPPPICEAYGSSGFPFGSAVIPPPICEARGVIVLPPIPPVFGTAGAVIPPPIMSGSASTFPSGTSGTGGTSGSISNYIFSY